VLRVYPIILVISGAIFVIVESGGQTLAGTLVKKVN